MISLSNGILKIKYTALDKAKFFYEIAFVLNMVVIFAGYDTSGAATVTAVIMFVASCWLLFEKNRQKIVIPYVTIWYLILIIYIGFSNLWVADFAGVEALKKLLRYLIILISTTSIAIYVDDLKDLNKIIDLFICGAVIITVLEFSATPFIKLSNGSFGSNFSRCNPNDITVWIDFAAIASFYRAYNDGKKGMYLITALMVLFCALSSSRKGFAASLVGPLMIVFFSFRKRGYSFKLILTLALVIGAAVLVMENEFLYSAIGVRYDKLFTYLQGGKVDTSTQLRTFFIDYAKEMFKESPIIGNGVASFSAQVERTELGKNAYAHNNYWQILSELGLVGFVLYYSMYGYVICSLIKSYFIRHRDEASLFISTLAMMLMLEMGIVSIDSKFAQLIIAIVCCSAYTLSNESQHIKNINKRKTDME